MDQKQAGDWDDAEKLLRLKNLSWEQAWENADAPEVVRVKGNG